MPSQESQEPVEAESPKSSLKKRVKTGKEAAVSMAKELKKRKAFCVSSATGEYDLFHAPFSFAREGRSLRVHGSVKGAC